MKSLLLFTVLSTAFLASSCRTVLPIDPMTQEPSTRCLPGSVTTETTTVVYEK